MHSSRMRTVRCSSRLPRGGVSARGVCLRGVCPGECLLGEGVVSARGDGWCLPGGDGVVSAQGVYPSMHWAGGVCPSACWHTPPSLWTEFLTHACENITFPQLNFTLSHLYYLPALFFAS